MPIALMYQLVGDISLDEHFGNVQPVDNVGGATGDSTALASVDC
jgi:hypothetical protein